MTFSYARYPAEGFDGFSHRYLARQARAVSAGDRSQIGSSSASNGLPPGESLTVGSLTFPIDGTVKVHINPSARPLRTIYIGVMAFIINNHVDLCMCLPPIHHIAAASRSIVVAYSPPTSGPWGLTKP